MIVGTVLRSSECDLLAVGRHANGQEDCEGNGGVASLVKSADVPDADSEDIPRPMSEAKEDVKPKWEKDGHLEGEDTRAVAVCSCLSAEGSDVRSKRARAEDVDDGEEEEKADEGECEDSVEG